MFFVPGALALAGWLSGGCSGINASKSVSPLDFILPGLIQSRPPSPVIPSETNFVPLLAQASPLPLQTHRNQPLKP